MTRPDLDAILPPVSAEDEATVDALLAKAREGVGKRPIGGRPDLGAIRARWEKRGHSFDDKDEFERHTRTDIPALLAYIDELEREVARLRREVDAMAAELHALSVKYDANVNDTVDAFQRGAEAMREACQQWCRAWENNGDAIADALGDQRVSEEPTNG